MQPQILLETLRGNKQGAEQLVRRFEEGRYQEEETKKRKRTETAAASMKKNRQSGAPTKFLQCDECNEQRPRESFSQRTWRAAQAAKKAKKYFQAVCKACTGGRKRQLFPCAKCGERKDITAYEEWAWRHREHRSPTCIGCRLAAAADCGQKDLPKCTT